MQPPNAAARTYEVEHRIYHAARPGFRIVEMQIGPTQTIPGTSPAHTGGGWCAWSSSRDGRAPSGGLLLDANVEAVRL